MRQKKRILISNEFSEFSSGFATYMQYILPLLYKTGKYEIAEHAINLNPAHPIMDDVPWKVYPNDPHPNDQQAWQKYSQDPRNNLGKWRFDEVVLDFKPDVVISIADPWWVNHIVKSALRSRFNFVFMPTCDGTPQKYEWIDDTINADVVLTYSLWAKYTLELESKGKIQVAGVASPGVDLNVFKPLENKPEMKELFGLPKDSIIFGTVMRNQPRKLFPEIMRAFVKYLQLCEKEGKHDLIEKSFLYFHTSYPDVGWALNEEIKRHKLSHKVLFTYMCKNCQHIFPSFFQGETCACKGCGQLSAVTTNPGKGVSRPILAKIMGMFDLYIQHSIAAGWEMPINDAKACGVYVLATEYSAMQEQCHNGGASPIPVKQFVQEPIQQTAQLRAWADNDKLAALMYEHVNLSKEDQNNRSQEARRCVEKYYAWERIAGVWETVLDQLPSKEGKWAEPPQFKQPMLQFPPNLSNQQFVEFALTNVLGKPELINSEYGQMLIGLLDRGYENVTDPLGRPGQKPVSRNEIVQSMLNEVNEYNQIENIRASQMQGIGNKGVRFVET